MPSPAVSISILALSTETFPICLRSKSSLSEPVFAANTNHFLSGLNLICSTLKFPGVSKRGSPPDEGIEYKCGHPSWYDKKTIRSLAAQCKLKRPLEEGTEPRNVSGAFHNCCAFPAAMSADQTAHSEWRSTVIESIAPPKAGLRINTIFLPSGDH